MEKIVLPNITDGEAFILFAIFAGAAFIQILYYLFFYIRIFAKIKTNENQEKKPVSVVICAKNEAENLKKNLPIILEQTYPEFQVVVVNDNSQDETETVLSQLGQKYDNLYVTTLSQDPRFISGKKLALSIGIKAAKYDNLLLTDADCRPVSSNWINLMQEKLSGNKEIVLGYGAYEQKKGLLNLLIRYDTLFIALQYITFAKAGLPYMGVGRNLAYKKSFFDKKGGFAGHTHIISGDDDLFVNKNANRKNTAVQIHHEARTISEPEKTFKQWIKQKKRHFTSSNKYKLFHKILLATEPLSRELFYLGSIIMLIRQDYLILSLSIILLRIILFYAVLLKAKKRFNEKKLIVSGLIFDIIFPFINFTIWFSNKFSRNKNKWN